MPIKRRFVRRRTNTKTSRRFRRKRFGARSRRPIPGYHYKRTAVFPNFNATADTFTGKAITFDLAAMPDHTDFTNLYDSYRINFIKVQLIPQYTTYPAGSTVTSRPRILTVIDKNDNSVPASESEMMTYSTFRRHDGNRTITRMFRPAVEVPMFVSIGSGGQNVYGFGARSRQWIETNTTNAIEVKHLGLKIGCDMNVGGTSQIYNMYVTYYMSFRRYR